jgi:hypothetical protein
MHVQSLSLSKLSVLNTVDFVFDMLHAVCRVCALRVVSPIHSPHCYTKADAFVVGLLEWRLLAVGLVKNMCVVTT